MKKPTASVPRPAEASNQDYLISQKQTCEVLGNCSKMHLWRLQHDPSYRSLDFPKPIERGKHGRHPRKFFWHGEVKAWIVRRAVSIGREAA
jgi:hypothetical protein